MISLYICACNKKLSFTKEYIDEFDPHFYEDHCDCKYFLVISSDKKYYYLIYYRLSKDSFLVYDYYRKNVSISDTSLHDKIIIKLNNVDENTISNVRQTIKFIEQVKDNLIFY